MTSQQKVSPLRPATEPLDYDQLNPTDGANVGMLRVLLKVKPDRWRELCSFTLGRLNESPDTQMATLAKYMWVSAANGHWERVRRMADTLSAT